MAYQNVATPRFYVNILEWLALNGLSAEPSQYAYAQAEVDVFHTLPVTPRGISSARTDSPDDLGWTNHFNGWKLPMYGNPTGFSFEDKGFIAILGHKITTTWVPLNLGMEGNMTSIVAGFSGWASNYYNSVFTPSGHPYIYSGYSISTYEGTPTAFGLGDKISVDNGWYDWKVGSVVIGTYYDMKNAPNLSLTMSREYGGTKEMTSYNGSSFSNTFWTKNPDWYDKGAWELGSGSRELTKSGRRVWQLSWSFMDGSDLFGSNQSVSRISFNTDQQNIDIGYESVDVLGYYDDGGLIDPASDESKGFTYNLLTDDNFFSQVWYKSAGGTIPMIFQPDNTNNGTDQFAIVRIRDKSLKATRVAPNTYDISLTLEEVW